MTDAQRFHELTGGCWHEYDKIIGLYNKCSCGKICGNLDEHIKQSNPTYTNPADILKRMRDYCGEERYALFMAKLEYGMQQPNIEAIDWDGSIDEDYVLNPSALLRKACEWLEKPLE